MSHKQKYIKRPIKYVTCLYRKRKYKIKYDYKVLVDVLGIYFFFSFVSVACITDHNMICK